MTVPTDFFLNLRNNTTEAVTATNATTIIPYVTPWGMPVGLIVSVVEVGGTGVGMSVDVGDTVAAGS